MRRRGARTPKGTSGNLDIHDFLIFFSFIFFLKFWWQHVYNLNRNNDNNHLFSKLYPMAKANWPQRKSNLVRKLVDESIMTKINCSFSGQTEMQAILRFSQYKIWNEVSSNLCKGSVNWHETALSPLVLGTEESCKIWIGFSNIL